jgi:CheY-like chemotaxis protein
MRGTVLIVHDDLGVRQCLGEFLASRSYQTLCVSSGAEALAVLEEDLPDLLVIGVGMPLMSGWKLVEALAHYPDLSRIPRLLLGPGEAPEAACDRVVVLLEQAASAALRDDGDLRTPATARPRRTASA